jgi:hypothetical protein
MGGRKTFVTNTVLTAADVQDFLMDQSVMVFSNSTTRGSGIPSPTEGMVSYLTGSDSLEAYNGTAWTSAAGVSSGNAIINGAFEINQRNYSSSTDGGFGFDRWQISQAGGTVTGSSQTFTPGAAPLAGLEARNFQRIVVSGQSASGNLAALLQRIEGTRTFAGQTVTVSFYAKSGSGTPKIGIEIDQSFGTGGSPSSPVNVPLTAVTISTSWTRYTATITLPSISGKTIGTDSNDNLVVLLWVSAGSDFSTRSSAIGIQNNTFEIWGVQLEAGSVANPFRRNANSLQGELAACQRYYYRSTSVDGDYTRFGQGLAFSSTGASIQVSHPSTMQVPPTSIEFSSLALYDGAVVSPTISAIYFDDRTNILNSFSVTTSGLTALRTQQLVSNNTRNAFLGFSAEI